MKTNDDGLTFEAWYKLADATVSDVCGLGLDDLPDGPSRDAWTDGVPAAEYALGILRYEGFEF